MKREVKKLFVWKSKRFTHFMPCGLNIFEQLWWRFVPGVVIKLRWPKGVIVIDHNDPRWYDVGAVRVEYESTDPNDHYRPWLEKHVGRQKWDWDWGFVGKDADHDQLTIKIRRKHGKYATLLTMMWAK